MPARRLRPLDLASGRTGLLCVIGDLVEDIVVWPVAPVQAATDNPAAVYRTRGGSGANVAALAAPFVPTRFVGCVGDDATGRWLADELAASGADVRLERGSRTGCVVVVVDPSGERTMFPDRAAAAELSAAATAWMDGVDVLHIPAYAFQGGTTATTVVALADAVRAAGGVVTLDASAASLVRTLGGERFARLVERVGARLLFANRDEADALGDAPLGDCALVIKHGPDPAIVLVPGEAAVEVPALEVEGVRDTTGAGDAFAAGTLAAWLHGADLVEACAAGHRAAATVLTNPGAAPSTEGSDIS